MIIPRPKNTKKSGMMEFFVYQEKSKFIGVCLTFDIVEEGEDLKEVMKNLEEAALLHLEVVCKENLSDDLLNRYAPDEYWEKYFEFRRLEEVRRVATSVLETKQIRYNPGILCGANL